MRYGPEHRKGTRRRILAAAARKFREGGFAGVGVDAVMAEAGLTAGGFYSHFMSKGALLAETLWAGPGHPSERLTAGLDGMTGASFLREVVRRYRRRSHRDDVGGGCALPTLAAEVARQGPEARAAVEAYLLQFVKRLGPRMPPGPGLTPDDRVLATAALAAGGIMLARAVGDRDLSERILRACRRLAVPELAEAGEPAP
jgi:TetR/AcrR family transcriptional regulator, transcriptional repressor for nem operon